MPSPHRFLHCNTTCILRPSLSLRAISLSPTLQSNFPTQFDPSLSLLPVLSQPFLSNIIFTFSLQLGSDFFFFFYPLLSLPTSYEKLCNSHHDWPPFELQVWPFTFSVCLSPLAACFPKPPFHFVPSCCQQCFKQHLFLISFISTLSSPYNRWFSFPQTALSMRLLSFFYLNIC